MSVTKNNGSKLKLIDLSTDATVSSGGGSDTITVQPDDGYIYKIKDMYVDIPDPSGSSSGSHTLKIYPDGFGIYQGMHISSNTGTDIAVSRAGFEGTTSYPSDSTEQHFCMCERFICSYSQTLTIYYKNSTDVNQSGTRTIKLLVEEIPERV